MTNKTAVMLGAALLGFATSAFANNYTFTDVVDGPGTRYLIRAQTEHVQGVSFTGQFDIISHGFVVGMLVDTATVDFWTHDDGDVPNESPKFTIKIQGTDWTTTQTTTGQYQEVFTLQGSSGGVNEIKVLLDIQADGKLDFTVSSALGDFYFDKAQLSVAAHSTPDGGATLSMLGLSMLGFVFTKRKLAIAR